MPAVSPDHTGVTVFGGQSDVKGWRVKKCYIGGPSNGGSDSPHDGHGAEPVLHKGLAVPDECFCQPGIAHYTQGRVHELRIRFRR